MPVQQTSDASTHDLLESLLSAQQRSNKLLEAISDQLELQYLQQFVGDAKDAIRVQERDHIRSQVFAKREDLGLE